MEQEQESTKEAESEQALPDVDQAAEAEKVWVQRIREAQEKADQLDAIRALAEGDAKRAKKNHEAAVDALQELIRRGPTTQMNLPFKDDADLSPEQKRERAWHEMLGGALIQDAIALKPKQLERLQEAGVKTMLDMENLRAGKMQDYPRGLLSIKGFGEEPLEQEAEDTPADRVFA